MALSARSRQWWVERVQHRGVLRIQQIADACRSTWSSVMAKVNGPAQGNAGAPTLRGFTSDR